MIKRMRNEKPREEGEKKKRETARPIRDYVLDYLITDRNIEAEFNTLDAFNGKFILHK